MASNDAETPVNTTLLSESGQAEHTVPDEDASDAIKEFWARIVADKV